MIDREDTATAPDEPQEIVQSTLERRSGELGALLDVHRENVIAAREQHRIPVGVPWHELTDDQQRRHGGFAAELASANRAYWRAVNETCNRHRTEDGPEQPFPASRNREGR